MMSSAGGYGISDLDICAAGKSPGGRRASHVAGVRTVPAAGGGAGAFQAEPAGAGVFRSGRRGAGNITAGFSGCGSLYLPIAGKLSAVAVVDRGPRNRRSRALPGARAARGPGSAVPVGEQSAGAGAGGHPHAEPAVRATGGGGAAAGAPGGAAGELPRGHPAGEDRGAYHTRDGGAAGQIAGGGGGVGVPGGEAISRIAGVPGMTDEEREQRLAEELADLMDQRAQGRKDAATTAHVELAGHLEALKEIDRVIEPAALPERLSGHKILVEIGSGGMGRVLLAVDEALGRKVAIKTLAERYADNPVLRARFMQEARAMARVNHPHVARIYNLGPPDEPPHFVMEYVEGAPLTRVAAAEFR